MAFKTRAFVSAVVVAGVTVLVWAGLHWRHAPSAQFYIYLLAALLSSRLKVHLPQITGTMSVNFLLILLGIANFSLPETLLLGCSAILVQCFCKDRPGPVQVVFNVCASSVAIDIGYVVFHFAMRLEHAASISLPLAAAASTYFLANTVPVAAIIGFTEQKSMRKIWAECYFWSFPYYLAGAAIAAMVAWLSWRVDWQTSLLVLPTAYLIYRSYRLYMGKLENEKAHVEEIANLHLRTIEALALAIEAKDHTTHAHLQRVRLYALEIAKELDISAEDTEALHAAALLHDIGKLAVPEHIISKPGKLTREEFEKVKIHPVVGAEILERVSFPYPVVPIVRSHHERWDGSGYPYGLKGEEIPIGARILAAIDFFDALTSDRQYRAAKPAEEAMQMLVDESGKSFDPRVVDILRRRYRDLEKLVHAGDDHPSAAAPSPAVKMDRNVMPATGLEEGSNPALSGGTKFLASISAARQEAQTLFELSQDLGASLSLGETLSVFSVKLKRLVPYDSIAIYIHRGEELLAEHTAGDNFRQLASLRIPLGEGLSGWVARNREPIINGDPMLEPGYSTSSENQAQLRSALVVPLEGVDGIVGVLALYRADTDAFTADHLRILLAISSKMGLALENALKYQQAESSATTDYLTGLPNARSLFMQLEREVERCHRTNSSLAVLVCDLDGFKQVNDHFGHLEGNRVLRLFAERLRQSCRGYDYVARMGGDEFVIVAPGLTPKTAQAKMTVLRELARAAGYEVCRKDILSLSVGVAIYPHDGLNAERLLAEADRSMYKAKKQQRNSKSRVAGGSQLFRAAVRLLPEGSTVPILGTLASITPGGCAIETGALLQCGTKIKIFYSAKDSTLYNEGTVTVSDPGSSVEVQFAHSENEAILRVMEHVERVTKRGRNESEFENTALTER
jgi:diguanylate cyclase (GGDEF)-like protein/putative nucleotidyltransferase with HDIG domain